MDPWVWFLIAAVAAVAGVALLFFDRARTGSRNRERRRWAGLRGWQFADVDAALPDRWRHGALAGGPQDGADGGADRRAGVARNVVTGSLFTAAGRRLVYVFDHQRGAGGAAVITAVHRRTPQPVVLELWLATVKFSAEGGLDMIGPVGDRYAFASDVATARPLITPELVDLADEAGEDVPVLWIEDAWVAASVGAGTDPPTLERLLRLLGDVADLVDGVQSEDGPRRGGAAVRGRPSGDDVYDHAREDAGDDGDGGDDDDDDDDADDDGADDRDDDARDRAREGAHDSAQHGARTAGNGDRATPAGREDAHSGEHADRPSAPTGTSDRTTGSAHDDLYDQARDEASEGAGDDAQHGRGGEPAGRTADRLGDAPKDRPS